MRAADHGAADGSQSGVYGRIYLRMDGEPTTAIETSAVAPQPTRTRTNYPEEWHSTEDFGLDFRVSSIMSFPY